MKIVEFCGTPGSGKSTLCDKLEQRLCKENFKVINLQKHVKCDTLKKKVIKIISYVRYNFCACNYELKKVLHAYSSKLPDKRNSRKWANRILEANWRIRTHEDFDYILFDEGFIQFITAMAGEQHEISSFETIMKVLKKNIYITGNLVIYCSVSVDENIRRIKTRNKPGDFFNDKSKVVMEEKLRLKKKNIEKVIKEINSPVMYVDMQHVNFSLLHKLIVG